MGVCGGVDVSMSLLHIPVSRLSIFSTLAAESPCAFTLASSLYNVLL